MIEEVGLLPYSERLQILELTTLAERRSRGDLIEVYKASQGLFQLSGVVNFSISGLNILCEQGNCDEHRALVHSRGTGPLARRRRNLLLRATLESVVQSQCFSHTTNEKKEVNKSFSVQWPLNS